MSLKSRLSVAKVLFSTDGLFFTLGKMIPPLRETVLPPAWTVWLLLPLMVLLLVLAGIWLLAVVVLLLLLLLLLLAVEEEDSEG